MKRSLGLLLVCLLFPLLPAFGQPAAETKPAFQTLSYQDAMCKARRSNQIVMIDFGATWCGPCKQLEATTFKNRRVEKLLAENFLAIKIDIDNQPALASQFNVQAVPTILFLNGEAKEVQKIIGYRNAEQFLEIASKINKK